MNLFVSILNAMNGNILNIIFHLYHEELSDDPHDHELI